jgi:hypothetical protein
MSLRLPALALTGSLLGCEIMIFGVEKKVPAGREAFDLDLSLSLIKERM